MKRSKYIRALACVCLAALLLAGCGKEEGTEMGGEVWKEMPRLTYGVMEYEKLQVLPWNFGRCEATSQNAMAETEQGFYCSVPGLLYYADKVDLSNWVPVCGKPNCSHTGRMVCNAGILLPEFVIQDDRIYFLDFSGKYRSPDSGIGVTLYSKALDGSDGKFAYAVGEYSMGGGSANFSLSSERWLVYGETLNIDGTVNVQLFCVDALGERLLHEQQATDAPGGGLGRTALRGDIYYSCYSLFPGQVFRIEGGQMNVVDASLIPDNGGYISGNTLRVFRQNDGYYDINIETGEEVKLADPQLENSDGQICLPNCIVESTLLFDAMDARTEGMTHSMMVFDGETWRSVQLPVELEKTKETAYIDLVAVTSDSILLQLRDEEFPTNISGKILYRIPLDAKDLKLEYCATIEIP